VAARVPLTSVIGQLRDVATGGEAIPLAAINGALGSTYTLLFAERVTDGGVQAPFVDGVDPAYGERLTRAAERHLLPSWLRGLQSGTVMDRASLQRDHDFAHSEFFDYVVRPEGRFHCLITTPYVTPTQRFHMIVGRPFAGDDFSGNDMRLLQVLLPHVGALIANGITLRHAKADAAMLASALDRLTKNIVLVSRDLHVAFANRGARRVLALADGLSVVDGTLAAADITASIKLRQAVASALGQPDRADATSIPVRRRSGLPALELAILPLAAASEPIQQQAGDPPLAMVLISDAEPVSPLQWSCVMQPFGLTGREHDLVGLLVSGKDLQCAAQALGIGYNTARYHLRHVFAKTDTHRQSELIRLALGMPAQSQG
jgi:DNA-binding CsgD family transcriptional regulator